jgi:hypothetical protein
MSRSRRKTPIAGYTTFRSEREDKELWHRRWPTRERTALSSAWARIAEEAGFPADYEGTPSPDAHRACEVIQELIREHIVATNDMRLFGLLHLLGQASLSMEKALWPEDYERMTKEIEKALQEIDAPNARSTTHEKS